MKLSVDGGSLKGLYEQILCECVLPADLEHLILGSGEFLNELLRRGPLGFGGIENVATGVAVSLRNRGNDKNGKKDRQQKTLPVGYMGQGFELRYFTERNIHRGKL